MPIVKWKHSHIFNTFISIYMFTRSFWTTFQFRSHVQFFLKSNNQKKRKKNIKIVCLQNLNCWNFSKVSNQSTMRSNIWFIFHVASLSAHSIYANKIHTATAATKYNRIHSNISFMTMIFASTPFRFLFVFQISNSFFGYAKYDFCMKIEACRWTMVFVSPSRVLFIILEDFRQQQNKTKRRRRKKEKELCNHEKNIKFE